MDNFVILTRIATPDDMLGKRVLVYSADDTLVHVMGWDYSVNVRENHLRAMRQWMHRDGYTLHHYIASAPLGMANPGMWVHVWEPGD